MNELVLTNSKGQDVTTSLIVAAVFEKRHVDVLRDIRNLHCSEEFRLRNFALLVEMKHLPQGGASQAGYYEITKDGFSFLVMGYTGEKAAKFKEDFIRAFNQRDALLKSDDYILARSQEILFERIKSFEQQLKQKEERLQLQEHEIKQAAPKVEYYDTVLQSDSAIAITVIANELGMSAKYLNKQLVANQVIRKVNDVYVLYAKYQGLGYAKPRTFHYTKTDGQVGTKVELYWSEKGRQFIHGLFKNHIAPIR